MVDKKNKGGATVDGEKPPILDFINHFFSKDQMKLIDQIYSETEPKKAALKLIGD